MSWCSCEKSANMEKLDYMFVYGFKLSDHNLNASSFATDAKIVQQIDQ